MIKRVFLAIAIFIVLGGIVFHFWAAQEEQKYGQHGLNLRECIKRKGPNQTCYLENDGTISLRDQFGNPSP